MNRAVIGLGFGDEGKGVVTDYLCSQNPASVVVRFSGGHQCAHTVVVNNVLHVFSSFGSGTLRGCPTYWGPCCTFEPKSFITEHQILKSKNVTPKITIHPECRVTTPYDVYANRHSKEDMMNGTTGTGFWQTVKRNRAGVHLSVAEVLCWSEEYLQHKLTMISEYYNQQPNEEISEMLEYFMVSVRGIKTMLGNNVFMDTGHLKAEEIVFEGNQGLLLDEDLGYAPHITASKCNLENVINMGYKIDQVFLVTRAYQTRHGNGPITNVGMDLNVCGAYEVATRENPYQGRLRKTVLDLDQLHGAVTAGITQCCKDNGILKNLVVTCLDQFVGKPRLTHHGQLIEFRDCARFAYYIKEALGVDGKVFGNYRPCSEAIKEL
jgi:adenylosuccinate synthase